MNNMNDIEKLKMEIAMFNATEDIKKKSNKTLLKNGKKRWGNLMKKKIIATACASLILVSGIVVAINSKKVNITDRGLGKGVETAIENGYIAIPEMDFMDFDDKGTKIKIENFFMDDLNLSINFLIQLEKNNNITDIMLNGLIIRDEENRIVFGGNNSEFFERYCLENNLDYTFVEFNNDNYIGCGINWFIESKEKDIIRLTYNIYSDGFPKSKKLYISLGTMIIEESKNRNSIIEKFKNKNSISNYELQGNWNVEIDVPENMYNRAHEEYRMVNCSSKNFNVYKAIVTDTGFELGFTVSNTFELKGGYIAGLSLYMVNDYGKKFKIDPSVSSRQKTEYFDNEMTCNNYETLGMTKYDATDKIYIIINYYGVPVFIELEKGE